MPRFIYADDDNKCKLLFKPVCECGFVFDYIMYNYPEELPFESENIITDIRTMGFTPKYCPNCKKMISGFELPAVSLKGWKFDCF